MGRVVASFVASCLIAALASAQNAPELHYRISFSPDPAPGTWDVEVRATGIDRRSSKVEWVLSDYGEWSELKEPYFAKMHAEPPLKEGISADVTAFRIDPPRKWNGDARIDYRVSIAQGGSARAQAHGLLPTRWATRASGWAQNTIVDLRVDGEIVAAKRTVTFDPPEGYTLVSGWTGMAEEPITTELAHPIDSCMIFFAREPRSKTTEVDDLRFEVYQFDERESILEHVLEFATTYVPAVEKTLAHPFGKPVRIYVTSPEGNDSGGGVASDHGLQFGFNSSPESPYFLNLMAHEMFHHWLPGPMEREGPSIVWFHEGFTDYLSLWFLAKTELISLAWFAERLLDLEAEARASDAYREVRLSDPEVDWRDGDGPIETLAYKGGATLAFLMDAELHSKKRPGVAALIAHLLHDTGSRYSLELVRAWMKKNKLASFYKAHVGGTKDWPRVRDELERLGFYADEREVEVHLTYFGVETDGDLDGSLGGVTVLAIDPDGPQAERDLRVGDRIVGRSAPRAEEVRLAPGQQRRYAFGLTSFPLRWPWWVDVMRDGEKVRVELEPWGQPGGLALRPMPDTEKVRAFFD